MLTIYPAIIISLGDRATRTLTRYMRHLQHDKGHVPAILPWIVGGEPAIGDIAGEPFQHTLLMPDIAAGEPLTWATNGRAHLPTDRHKRTRAAACLAWAQQVDQIQGRLLQNISRMFSLPVVEQMKAMDLPLTLNGQIDIYVLADLGDWLGSGVFIDAADLIAQTCRQIGLTSSMAGLLYLPDATSPSPLEEATAYAALKELEHRTLSRLSPGRDPVFNAGCYLFDTVNQAGYTFADESQQIQIVSEWLYTMTCSNMAATLRAHRTQRYQSARLRGHARCYDSIGMAVRYVPLDLLTDWMTAQWSLDVLHNLTADITHEPTCKQAQAWIERLGLSHRVLLSRLQHQHTPDIQDATQPLRRARLNQMDGQTRQSLRLMREKHLPTLRQNLAQAIPSACSEIDSWLDAAVQMILEDTPRGAVPAAQQFLVQLQAQIAEQKNGLQELRREQRRRLHRAQETGNAAQSLLRSAVMSSPPWGIIGASMLSLLLPVPYLLHLIGRVIWPQHQVSGGAAILILFVALIGTIGWSLWQGERHRRITGERHARMVQERFELECLPHFEQIMSQIYDHAQQAIAQAQAQLDLLSDELERTIRSLRQDAEHLLEQIEQSAQPGLMRSVINAESSRRLYHKTLADSLPQGTAIWSRIKWSAAQDAPAQSERPAGWLGKSLHEWGHLLVCENLSHATLFSFIPQSDIQPTLKHMCDDAQPLWNYDPASVQRIKTHRMTLLGSDLNLQPDFDPSAIPVQLADRHRLIVIQVHQGMPLWAIRRIAEYRRHYAAFLRHGQIPLHTAPQGSLAPDLIASRPAGQPNATALFAAALALNIVINDEEHGYRAPQSQGRTLDLGKNRLHAVALLGMDEATCRAIQQRLERICAEKGRATVQAILDEYMTMVPDLEDWEIRGILDWGKFYGLEFAG